MLCLNIIIAELGSYLADISIFSSIFYRFKILIAHANIYKVREGTHKRAERVSHVCCEYIQLFRGGIFLDFVCKTGVT